MVHVSSTGANVPRGGSDMNGIGTSSTSQNEKIAVVDSRNLYREVILGSLQECDPGGQYISFASIIDWVSSEYRNSVAIVYISAIGDGSPQSRSAEKQLAEARSADPRLRFVILGDVDDPAFVLKALELGASGYIPSSLSSTVVVKAVNLVSAGGVFVPATSMKALATRAPKETPETGGFSPRQVAVARELRKGTPNKTIAFQLNMAESTVKVHVRQIMKKLKARNRTEVAFLTNKLFGNDELK